MPQFNAGKCIWLILYGCQGLERMDERWCKQMLRRLAEDEIHMTLLPANCAHTLTHPEDPEKSGVSACQLIAESHLAVHTWPESRGVTLLVYSCRKFKTHRLVRYVQRMFRPQIIDVREAERKYVLCRKEGAL